MVVYGWLAFWQPTLGRIPRDRGRYKYISGFTTQHFLYSSGNKFTSPTIPIVWHPVDISKTVSDNLTILGVGSTKLKPKSWSPWIPIGRIPSPNI